MRNAIRKHWEVASLLVLVAVSAVGIAFLGLGREEAGPPVVNKIRYSFLVHNPTSRVVHNAGFRTYIPQNAAPVQSRAEFDASHPFQFVVDRAGNELAEFQFPYIAPNATQIVTLAATIERRDALAAGNRRTSARWTTTAEHLIESDAPEIRALASRMQRDSERETIRRVFSWVSENIQYAGYWRDDRGALYAVKNRKGDCTEYAYLTTALLRAIGFEARPAAGFVVRKDTVLDSADYHNWAEVFSGGKWRVVDSQQKKLDRDAGGYVAMRLIRTGDSAAAEASKSQQLFEALGPVEVTMRRPRI